MKRVLLTFVNFLISPGTVPISEVKDEEFERTKDLKLRVLQTNTNKIWQCTHAQIASSSLRNFDDEMADEYGEQHFLLFLIIHRSLQGCRHEAYIQLQRAFSANFSVIF